MTPAVLVEHPIPTSERREVFVRAYQIGEHIGALTGHDLACWCPLDQPCHADVLLELANGGAS